MTLFFFLTGFTGHVPKSRFLIGKGYPIISSQALIKFGKQQRREPTSLPEIYPSSSGVVPSSAGHVPGQSQRLQHIFIRLKRCDYIYFTKATEVSSCVCYLAHRTPARIMHTGQSVSWRGLKPADAIKYASLAGWSCAISQIKELIRKSRNILHMNWTGQDR